MLELLGYKLLKIITQKSKQLILAIKFKHVFLQIVKILGD